MQMECLIFQMEWGFLKAVPGAGLTITGTWPMEHSSPTKSQMQVSFSHAQT
jgi:hypothetical protein